MDRTARLWHLEYTFPLRIYAGHEKDVDVVRFHPNCNYLATAGADKTVRLWSHADAKMVRNIILGNSFYAKFAILFWAILCQPNLLRMTRLAKATSHVC